MMLMKTDEILMSVPWRRMALGAFVGGVLCLAASWWHWHSVVVSAASSPQGFSLGYDEATFNALAWCPPWVGSLCCAAVGAVIFGLWEPKTKPASM